MRRLPPSSLRTTRGYALLIVLLVLGLMSVGLGTLLYFLEASAQTTSSMLERRRVFYACDGIGRAATVLAQKYMTVSAPSSGGLIQSVCNTGGGGCCASDSATGACDTATPPAAASRFTVLTAPDPGPTALPKIVPAGFKVKEFQIASLALSCTTDAQCIGGTCVAGSCRTVGPLPNGPFQGMNARQDTIAIALRAEHTATTQFACKTRQTITLGKIAMFQFFLFSDSTFTDWHPGPAMRASGRMHANGNLGIDPGAPVMIERVTAAGDLRCLDSSGALVMGDCTSASTTGDARIANKLNPDFSVDADFTLFKRVNASWTQDALTNYGNGNAQDKAHGVPRLQLPIVGSPEVQRGFDAADNAVDNVNTVTTPTGTTNVANSRLLVDPVRPSDAADVRGQKFSFLADIRIINGVWYLKNPAAPNSWPGVPIWSDHGGTHQRTAVEDLKAATDPNLDVGQRALAIARSWASRIPQRFSYYGTQAGAPALTWDLDDTALATLRPPQSTRAVVSYGSLFRDNSTGGEQSAVWRPGLRTQREGSADSWCEPKPGAATPTLGMLDVLALDVAATTPCPDANVDGIAGNETFSVGAGLLAATRSGFRNGFAEFFACGSNDDTQDSASSCDANPEANDRRQGNVLPLNFDVAAFQEALADHGTAGELGSYFCDPASPTCSAFMGRPFNGIVYIAAPFPGSENGYGANGGAGTAAPPSTPLQNNPGHLAASQGAAIATRPRGDPSALAGDLDAVAWSSTDSATTARLLPVLVDAAKGGARREIRDDEIPALPFPLCTDAGDTSGVAPGTFMTTRGYVFTRPNCNNAATFSRINGVRIINARRVNSNDPPDVAPDIAEAASLPTVFPTRPVLSAAALGELPDGLSIITNLPTYVVGDVNITSDAWNTDLSQPWVPVLIGGDVVHPMSNFWDDANSRWALSTGDQTRRAMVTRYNMEMLSGWGMTVPGSRSGGIHNFPRFLEDWGSGATAECRGSAAFTGGCPAIIIGSLVIGHNRVYTLGRGPEVTPGNIGRSPPRRDWGFDRHLEDLEKQPPGAPVYDVSAIQQWSRN